MYRKTYFFVMVLTLTIGLSLLAGLVAVLAAPPLQEGGQDYIVVADDWLSKLAEKYLGNVFAYWAIVEYTNQKHAEDASYAEITDPDLIEVGWKIYIPSAEEAAIVWPVSTRGKECDEREDTSKVVTCTFGEGAEEPVSFLPIRVEDRQPLELTVMATDTTKTTTHFTLKIDEKAYPEGQVFTLTVVVTPTKTIADACYGKDSCPYPEVCDVTGDNHLKIRVADTCEYTAFNPYAVSVSGIREFSKSVTASISISLPREALEEQEHGVMIYHPKDRGQGSSREGEAERYSAELILDPEAEGALPRVQNRDPVFRCCRMHGD